MRQASGMIQIKENKLQMGVYPYSAAERCSLFLKWLICPAKCYMRLPDYNSSHSDLYWEANFCALHGTANCVRQGWRNLTVVLLFSLLNRGGYLGWAQAVSTVSSSVSKLPALPSSSRLPDCVCYDVMLQQGCVQGCVGGGRLRGRITIMAEPLTFWSWPSRHQPSEASLQQRGQDPHVATSQLLALAWANDLGLWPQGQNVRRRPWANTSFSECSNKCIQHPINCISA